MSGQTTAQIGSRLRRVMANSGPAVIVAAPIVAIVVLLLNGVNSTSLSSRSRTTGVDPATGSLLLNATNATTDTAKRDARARAALHGKATVAARTPTTRLRRQTAGLATAGTAGVARGGLASAAATSLPLGWDPGGATSAERSAIRAQLQYDRVTTACPALSTLLSRGGLDAQLATAISEARATALRRGASAAETDTLIQRALQSVLIASGAAPRDVLTVVVNLERTYVDCNGDGVTLAALNGLGAMIRAQLNYSQPAAIGGPGPAPIGAPLIPLPGGLGTATYLQRIQGH